MILKNNKPNDDLIQQWHPTKNGDLTPKHVTAGSNKKVWWLCENNHEWEAVINGRGRCLKCLRSNK